MSYTFPANSTINPKSFFLLVKNITAFRAVYAPPGGVPLFGGYSGELGNGGDKLCLFDSNGVQVEDLSYDSDFPWPIGDDVVVTVVTCWQVRMLLEQMPSGCHSTWQHIDIVACHLNVWHLTCQRQRNTIGLQVSQLQVHFIHDTHDMSQGVVNSANRTTPNPIVTDIGFFSKFMYPLYPRLLSDPKLEFFHPKSCNYDHSENRTKSSRLQSSHGIFYWWYLHSNLLYIPLT